MTQSTPVRAALRLTEATKGQIDSEVDYTPKPATIASVQGEARSAGILDQMPALTRSTPHAIATCATRTLAVHERDGNE